eukprot:Gb_25757 [translate_table: standard]
MMQKLLWQCSFGWLIVPSHISMSAPVVCSSPTPRSFCSFRVILPPLINRSSVKQFCEDNSCEYMHGLDLVTTSLFFLNISTKYIGNNSVSFVCLNFPNVFCWCLLFSCGQRGKMPDRFPLPPPLGIGNSTATQRYPRSESFQCSSPGNYGYDSYAGTAPPVMNDSRDAQMCPICLMEPKDLAFGCGHQTCYACGQDMTTCPICRSEITTRIKLY